MKIKFLLLIIAIFSVLNSFSQEYVPFPDSDAVWSVNECKYVVMGDTTINSVRYKKYYYHYGYPDVIYNKLKYFAALKEYENRKVYAIFDTQTDEKLIYDFSLNVGDTATVYSQHFYNPDFIGYFDVIIYNIDSILIGDKYRKRFKIFNESAVDPNEENEFDEYWIEGIGSTNGIFHPGVKTLRVNDVGLPDLLCFERNGYKIYDNPQFSSCFVSAVVVINELKTDYIKICNNPIVSCSKLIFKECIVFYIDIYNIKGKKIKTFDVKNKNSIEICRNQFEPGNYIIMFSDKNRRFLETIKIIIN